jgi:acetyl esterase
MTVIGVDYALSPEARYPVALHQLIDVLRWLPTQAQELALDPRRLVVGGDYPGANLSQAAFLTLRDAGDGDLVRAMVLNYGAYDVFLSEIAEQQLGGPGHILEADEMRGYWTNYVRGPEDFDDPLVCPLKADLAGLPPCFMVIAEHDVLAEQNLDMSRRLQDAGIEVQARVYSGTTHSFLEAMSIADVSQRALDDTADWLQRTLEKRVA